jgi:hypothetical protein
MSRSTCDKFCLASIQGVPFNYRQITCDIITMEDVIQQFDSQFRSKFHISPFLEPVATGRIGNDYKCPLHIISVCLASMEMGSVHCLIIDIYLYFQVISIFQLY